jgi:hypothetical protein
MSKFATVWVAVLICAGGVSSAFAQEASITGTVKDSGGAVLPGVTVEASSPALIEKVRTVTTDGTGQYRVVGLRPGTYTVTFTLAGFSGVKREGIELMGSFTATINAEMSVGAISENITVTGESPVVDVQSAKQQRVLASEVIEALPSARTHQTLAIFVPGVNEGGQHDVGGTGLLGQQQPTIHGSDSGAFRLQNDGFILGNLYQSYTGTIPNMGSAQEVTINSGAGLSDQWTGGLLINIIPKDGGNQFSGALFATGANGKWQADNYTQRLKDRGLRSKTSLKETHDINPGFGGPVIVDKAWFYGSARWVNTQVYPGGTFYNKNAGLKDVWTYDPDLSRPAYRDNYSRGANGRVTWQASQKDKLAFSYEYQEGCTCLETGFGTPSSAATVYATPEASAASGYPSIHSAAVTWSNPVTSRLLLEAGLQVRDEANTNSPRPPAGDPRLDLIPVFDFSRGIAYHGTVGILPALYHTFDVLTPQVRASSSYVSGAHALKIGYTEIHGRADVLNTDNNFGLRFTFNNGIPISLTQVAAPYPQDQNYDERAVYAQDKWTVGRLTLNLGVRFDHYKTSVPAMHFGPGPLVPNRNFDSPAKTYYDLKDLTPRIAAAWDALGTGKTALKASLNRYLSAPGGGTGVFNGNPALFLANTVARNWNDTNGNFAPDCDLINQATNGECGPGNPNFGSSVPGTVIDPDTLKGWGNRGYNWEFSAGVQQQVLPRVSVDIAYFRRIYGNLLVTDNRTLAPADYDPFSLTAPVDPRLPGGGGYQVPGLFNLKPTRVGLVVDNLQTFAEKYGTQRSHWNGADVNVSARLEHGLTAAGGFSTGRAFTDNCDVVIKLDNPSPLFCKSNNDWLTQIKAYAAYMIPKADVQVAATFQSIPGPPITAAVVFTNAQVQQTLGRPLSANAATLSQNVVEPGTMYGERLNQIDFRAGKMFRFGSTRTALNLDVFNLFNRDTVLALSSQYAVWQSATAMLQGRIAKVSVQFNF